jgi:hypothetical protein
VNVNTWAAFLYGTVFAFIKNGLKHIHFWAEKQPQIHPFLKYGFLDF